MVTYRSKMRKREFKILWETHIQYVDNEVEKNKISINTERDRSKRLSKSEEQSRMKD